MERRFIAWLAISFGLLILYTQVFAPPQRPPRGEPGDAADRAAADADQADRPQPLDEEPPDDAAAPARPAALAPPLVAKDVPLEYVTLGSLDPSSPYRLLLTFTNEGAALHRSELVSHRYRDLHEHWGYLGSLELVNAEGGGVRVRVVGPGTPAANAGLRPGDVIKAFGDASIRTVDDFSLALSQTRPRRKVVLQVDRDGQRLRPEVTLIRPPQEVTRPELENVLARKRQTDPTKFDDQPSYVLTLQEAGGQTLADDQRELPDVELLSGRWEIVDPDADKEQFLFVPRDADEVVFRKVLPDLFLEVYKRYRIARASEDAPDPVTAPAYHFDLEIGLRNLGKNRQTVSYRLDGPTGLPTEGWWFIYRIGRDWFWTKSGASGLRDVIARFENRAAQQFGAKVIADGDDGLKGGRPEAYVGADSLYFASVVIPKKQLTEQWFDRVEAVALEPKLTKSDNLALSNVTFRLIRRSLDLDPGQSHTDAFTVFCGPKKPAVLEQYQPAGNPEYALDDLVYYGWFWWVAKPMLGILSFFYSIVGNYGIAIIMLTVLVRACMLPLSLKQARNMAKMQELQPEMQKIAEKYKNDMEKRARAQQELFRKHNYNPLGGCLMAFVQLPIFIGLYRGLMLDIELRQAPLFTEAIRWCSNLGAPDMLLDWSSWMPGFIQGFLGPYLNILPIVTIFFFLLQQKLFMPEPTNEQAAMQQKIMKFMMIFIGFLFYKVASGLCLYFIASSVWSIVERKLIPHPARAGAAAATGGAEPGGAAKKVRPTGDQPRPGRNGHPETKARAKARRRK